MTVKYETAHDTWSEIITPKGHLFDLRLKEVWHYRDLLLLFVKRDMASQYRQTILGPLWYVIQPLLTTVMFLIVFTKIAKISTDHIPPVLFYMSGIAIWNYFSSCLNNTSGTFVNNTGIFGKVYFPRLVMPLSNVLSNIVKFAIQLGIVLIVALYYAFTDQYAIHAAWHMLLIPVIVVVMAGMGLSLGILISSLTTKYRDLTILISFGIQLLMYVTPVVYPLSYLEQSKYKSFIEWNPLSPMIESFRYGLFGEGIFNIYFFGYSIVFTIVIFFIAIVIFSKVERTFMDTV
jgi:lipopolysaccharide transport system permease protein